MPVTHPLPTAPAVIDVTLLPMGRGRMVKLRGAQWDGAGKLNGHTVDLQTCDPAVTYYVHLPVGHPLLAEAFSQGEE